ncbi:hypothetical protein [Thermotalea metallivorans]|uniref:Uncharacterized protein n=1 Tax=Thermotalea metallivorans TaxID=520762 RepID=A0A140LCJ7_9FIRM|nr:hypothetical protein [Thermotalea metallivorans]KXG78272.1 hypothetical protein AN619_02470 [Thermotalea metallivorans]
MKTMKDLVVANFNCTFGKDDRPMLDYFDKIIYPALNGDIKRKPSENDYYFFDEVKVIEYQKDEFVLVGLLIKSTKLEVKSIYKEGKGLIRINEKYNSDPYSIFLIFLKNHRMVLVRNQKGSPDIRSFGATINYVINEYIKEINRNRQKENKLPYANVHVVSIPSQQTIIEQLQEVKQINTLIMKFYPLNGDMPVGRLFNSLRDQIDFMGSKTGNFVANTPKNRSYVAQLISETGGTVEPTVKVTLPNGDKKVLKSDSFTEKIDVEISEDEDFEYNIYEILTRIKERKEIKESSENHKVIYLENLNKIKKVRDDFK